MTITLNRENVSAAIDKAIEKRGEDFRYRDIPGVDPLACRYVVKGQPACIVGEILIDLGVPLTVLQKGRFRTEHNAIQANNASRVGHLLPALAKRDVVDGLDDEALVYALERAQSVQDDDGTWGHARRTFQRILADRPVVA